MTSVKTSASPTQGTGSSKYDVIIDVTTGEEKTCENVSKDKKGKLYESAHLCTPEGLIYNGGPRNFIVRGENVRKKTRSGSNKGQGYVTKPPKVGTITFGNEGIPKMSHHLAPLRNYLFSGFVASTTLVSLTIGTYTNWTYTLSQLDNVSAFTALYDEYCVRRIEMWFLPATTEQTTINKTPYNLYTAYDMDGASVASTADIRQYENVVVTNVTEGQYLCYTPSVAIATYGGAFTKYSYEMNQWLDVANTDINLYGAASVIDGAAVNNDWQFAVHARLWVEFRGVR